MKTTGTIHYRQGDVLIERIAGISGNATKQKPSTHLILAHGEVTGHHHALTAESPVDWFQPDEMPAAGREANPLAGRLYVSLPAGGVVTHQEHSKIQLPAGHYRIIRQREYSPEAIRNVAD